MLAEGSIGVTALGVIDRRGYHRLRPAAATDSHDPFRCSQGDGLGAEGGFESPFDRSSVDVASTEKDR